MVTTDFACHGMIGQRKEVKGVLWFGCVLPHVHQKSCILASWQIYQPLAMNIVAGLILFDEVTRIIIVTGKPRVA
jgi:hypothetical protein